MIEIPVAFLISNVEVFKSERSIRTIEFKQKIARFLKFATMSMMSEYSKATVSEYDEAFISKTCDSHKSMIYEPVSKILMILVFWLKISL